MGPALATERSPRPRRRPTGCDLGGYAWIDAPTRRRWAAATAIRDGRSGQRGLPARATWSRRAPPPCCTAVLPAARGPEASAGRRPVRRSRHRPLAARRVRTGQPGRARRADQRRTVDAGLGALLPAMRDDMPLMDGSGRRRLDGLHAGPLGERWSHGSGRRAGAAERHGRCARRPPPRRVGAPPGGRQPGRAQPALTALDSGVTMPAQFDVVSTVADSEPTTWRVVLPLAPEAVDALGRRAARRCRWPHRDRHRQHRHDDGHVGRRRRGRLRAARRATAASACSTCSRSTPAAAPSSRRPSWLLRSTWPTPCSACRWRPALERRRRRRRSHPAAALTTPSSQIEWLHDVADVRPVVDAFARLDLSGRATGSGLGVRFISTAPGVVVASVGDLPAGPVVGLLLDSWSEATPGTTATTGVAIHYDVRGRGPAGGPRGRPAEPVRRLVGRRRGGGDRRDRRPRPGAHGPPGAAGALLPATYLADNTAGEVVSTNFTDVGVLIQMQQA